jgi:hypothetical protein
MKGEILARSDEIPSGFRLNGGALAMCLFFHKNKNGKGIATNAMLTAVKNG